MKPNRNLFTMELDIVLMSVLLNIDDDNMFLLKEIGYMANCLNKSKIYWLDENKNNGIIEKLILLLDFFGLSRCLYLFILLR